MSKSLQITIYTKADFHCRLKSTAALLQKAGWSIANSSGKIALWNEASSEWEHFGGTEEEFLNSDMQAMFRAYSGIQTISVCVSADHIDIFPEAYASMISYDSGKHFDFNRYYERFVETFNSDETIVERVVFEEY